MMTGIEWGEIDLVVILSIALPIFRHSIPENPVIAFAARSGDSFIILLLNGIYDIVCAYSILYVKNKHFFFANIHKDMYVNEADFKERYFSYWIFLNGVVRMISSIDPRLYSIASVTYFVESLVFTREYTMVRSRENQGFPYDPILYLFRDPPLPMSGFFAKSCCGFL
jgi:hypothetical protein